MTPCGLDTGSLSTFEHGIHREIHSSRQFLPFCNQVAIPDRVHTTYCILKHARVECLVERKTGEGPRADRLTVLIEMLLSKRDVQFFIDPYQTAVNVVAHILLIVSILI